MNKTMKIILLTVLVLLVLAVTATQVYDYKSTKDIEMYNYQVIQQLDEIEIRAYEPATFSSVKLNGKQYSETANKGFRILAGYIFGGNEANESIPMTSPVAMELNDSVTMRFMVPKDYKKEELPKPNDERIEFITMPEKKVAAIRFGGFANDEKIEEYKNRLKEILAKNNIEHFDTFTYLGYNPPFRLINRRNEIIVELKN